jgi:hypothetical protein
MLGVGVVLTSSLYPMLFQGQEMLTYKSFDFPNPPPIDWNLPTINSGIVSLVSDLISLRCVSIFLSLFINNYLKDGV